MLHRERRLSFIERRQDTTELLALVKMDLKKKIISKEHICGSHTEHERNPIIGYVCIISFFAQLNFFSSDQICPSGRFVHINVSDP